MANQDVDNKCEIGTVVVGTYVIELYTHGYICREGQDQPDVYVSLGDFSQSDLCSEVGSMYQFRLCSKVNGMYRATEIKRFFKNSRVFQFQNYR